MKLSTILLVLLLVGFAFGGQAKPAGEMDKKAAPADAKQARWQGHIVRINKDQSSMSIRGGQSNMESLEKTVFFDGATEWTKQGKPAKFEEFKEGSFVIALGHNDDNGVLHATRIDLRLPR